MNHYGVFAQIVSIGGTIIAVGAAMGFAWRRNTKWEPLEEDLGSSSRKVAGLLTSIVIVLLWYYHSANDAVLTTFIIITAVTLLVTLLVYSFLVGKLSYVKVVVKKGKAVDKKIIGGFKMTAQAKETIKNNNITVQEYYRGTSYNDDYVWERNSKTFAKTLFIFLYILLVASGTICLAAGSLLVAIKINGH